MTVSIPRRRFLQGVLTGVTASTSVGWFGNVARMLAENPQRRRQCVLLWMAGGPSQLDTFDPKPGHANGGEFTDRPTSAPGLRIGEHLPKLAEWGHYLAPVRSLSTNEGDHSRGCYAVRTGRRPGGPVRDPDIGALLSKELANPECDLPAYVSVDTPVFLNPAAFSPGFLGPSFAAAVVGVLPPNDEEPQDARNYPRLGLDYLHKLSGREEWRRRWWEQLQRRYLDSIPAPNAVAHDIAYRRALRLLDSPAAAAFDLEQEADSVRDRYGRTVFGQGCLLARRLLEHGVAFVEVALGGNGLRWDTHSDNFRTVRALCEELDAGWSALMEDLSQRGLLETTTILWIGEFGRTPTINAAAGRDHYPEAWSCVFAGGGIRGGQAFGKTSPGGEEVVEGKVTIADVLATLCAALGIDPAKENLTPLNRPVKISDGNPIRDLLT